MSQHIENFGEEIFTLDRAGILAIRSFVVACVMTVSGVAHAAGSMTAGDFQMICTGSGAENKTACRFYILGVAQGIGTGLVMAGGQVRGGRLCLPEVTPGSAMEFVVKKALGEDLMFYPEDKNLEAVGFIGAALVKQWPYRRWK